MEPEHTLERAEKILRNIYKAVGNTSHENGSEILRQGRKRQNDSEWRGFVEGK